MSINNSACFSATYSDWRLIKGRKVVQIVFEVPVEHANVAYEVLGGMPNPAAEVWCGVARLNMEAPKAPPSTPDHPHVPTTGERKPLTLAARAALLCKDPLFHRYLEDITSHEEINERMASEWLRSECWVKSRSEILPNTRAAKMFEQIYTDFVMWREAPAVVE